ncbi:MAG: NYN domain-containing protein [Micrococcales bacterium]|nr:NYN domain-containing protein [Micrococcales bacterium]
MPDASTARVAVYIDFDNIVMSRYDQVHRTGRRDTPWRNDDARNSEKNEHGADIEQKLWRARVDIGAILDYASSFGSIVISRAYADWSVPANAGYRRDVVDRAIDLTQLFTVTSGLKNGADIRLSVDIVEDLFRLPDVTHVVIVAGDSDYIALAQRAKRLGRLVVGIGVSGSTSSALISACDVFTLYDDLPDLQEPAVTGGEADAAPAPAAPETSAAREPSKRDRDAATELLVRALRLVEDKNDEDWQFQGDLKQQMLRLNPAFKEKPLGFRTFTEFLEGQKRVAEIRNGTQANERRVRLRERG